jgi:hypothetical protein
VQNGRTAGARPFDGLERDRGVGAGVDQAAHVRWVLVRVVVVGFLTGRITVPVGLPVVRRFQREVARGIDAQHHSIRGAKAAAREGGK